MHKACTSDFSVDGVAHIFDNEDGMTEVNCEENENDTGEQVKSDTETRDKGDGSKDTVVTEDLRLHNEGKIQDENIYTPKRIGMVVK